MRAKSTSEVRQVILLRGRLRAPFRLDLSLKNRHSTKVFLLTLTDGSLICETTEPRRQPSTSHQCLKDLRELNNAHSCDFDSEEIRRKDLDHVLVWQQTSVSAYIHIAFFSSPFRQRCFLFLIFPAPEKEKKDSPRGTYPTVLAI
jgi:hypothetical protein